LKIAELQQFQVWCSYWDIALLKWRSNNRRHPQANLMFYYIVDFLLYIVHVKYFFQIEITGALVGNKKVQKKDNLKTCQDTITYRWFSKRNNENRILPI